MNPEFNERLAKSEMMTREDIAKQRRLDESREKNRRYREEMEKERRRGEVN